MISQMNDRTIRVVARIAARPDKIAELQAVLIGMVEPTRKEKGCISYVMHQNTASACDFVCIEEWESHAALDAHLKAPHMQEAFAKAGPLVAGAPEISTYTVIE